MSVRALITAFLLTLACASAAMAEPERLEWLPYPDGATWKQITDQNDGETHWWHEFIHNDQDVETYKDILSGQEFPGGRDPSAFINGIFARMTPACETMKVNGPKTGTEGGFAVAYAQIYCGRQKGKDFGVNLFVKAIDGGDAFFS